VKYAGVLNNLKGYYTTRSTINHLNRSIGINGSSLLVLLHIKEGYTTLFTLDKILPVDRTLIYRSIIDLEKSNIITRYKKEKSKYISITQEGEKILEEAIMLYGC